MNKTQIAETLAGAKCFCGYTKSQHAGVQGYLLALIAGGSTDAQYLVSQSSCYACIHPSIQDGTFAYLMQQFTGVAGTPQQIIALSPCASCVPPGQYESLKTYLLYLIAYQGSTAPTPTALLNLAREFINLTPIQQYAVLTYTAEQAGGGGPPTPSGTPEQNYVAGLTPGTYDLVEGTDLSTAQTSLYYYGNSGRGFNITDSGGNYDIIFSDDFSAVWLSKVAILLSAAAPVTIYQEDADGNVTNVSTTPTENPTGDFFVSGEITTPGRFFSRIRIPSANKNDIKKIYIGPSTAAQFSATLCISLVTNGGGDTFDCYVESGPVTTLPNGGTAFSGVWIIGDSPISTRYDTFDTYTVSSPTTETLNAGYGFSAAWIYGDGKVPYGDTFESYTVADPTTATLNGGTGSSVAWEYGDAAVAFSYGDTFESYTVADPTTATLNGGTGSSAAWEYGDATTMTYLGDSFDTYTVGAPGTLSAGTGFSGAWIYA